MEAAHHLILFGSALIVISIFAGLVSSRFGAPLLLVFLALGMIAGEEGPGGIVYNDFAGAYLIGSVALAVVLFDGGMRTKLVDFQVAAAPAIVLSTFGVVLTAGLLGSLVHLLLDFGWLESFLIGSVIASTDAAAVFFLLNLRGMKLQQRVNATLEVESGINDPMAVFLTMMCVEFLRAGQGVSWSNLGLHLVMEMAGGAAMGAIAGFGLVVFINRFEIAQGLYPILALAVSLLLFGSAQTIGASGFLAVYIAGLIVGNTRHRGTALISRFHDGLAWLAQIVMFLILGLLVTPSNIIADWKPAVISAAILMFVARPFAVAVCLAPFRFSMAEIGFISWIGLRGAVPIFLATMPVLAGLTGSMTYFSIAFVVVLASLAFQGWTIGPAAQLFGMVLPPEREAIARLDIDVANDIDRDIASYRVAPRSAALGYPYRELPLPRRTRILSVLRDGAVLDRTKIERLKPRDYLIVLARPVDFLALDRLFAAKIFREDNDVFGEFILEGDMPYNTAAGLYALPPAPESEGLSLAAFMAKKLRHRAVVGDRLRLGPVELVVREMVDRKIAKIGIELEPEEHTAWHRIRKFLHIES